MFCERICFDDVFQNERDNFKITMLMLKLRTVSINFEFTCRKPQSVQTRERNRESLDSESKISRKRNIYKYDVS